MLWIIQENLYNENKRDDLINALTRLDIPFLLVNVHQNKIEPDIPLDNTLPIITNGSIMLSNIARARGWEPGGFLNDNFSYTVWAEHYKELLLNKNAAITTIKNAKAPNQNMFMRPILDNKSFNGKVFTPEEFLLFQKNCVESTPGFTSPETEIILAPTKKIGQEHRHYIVDGKVITSSRYKLSGQPNFAKGADQAVIDVVNQALSVWQPARAFVLDTYIAGEEIGIVELGSICHAGLYEADIMRLIDALDNMPNYPAPAPSSHFIVSKNSIKSKL